MSKSEEIKGFALLCDANGIITEVLRDDFGLADNNSQGKLFANLVESSYRKAALDFLMEIRARKISFDRRLNLRIDHLDHGFYFIGVQLASEILIIAADNHKDAVDFVNYLQQINNEQSNQIRQLLKKQSESFHHKINENESLFDEISHLNNELVNVQRELTRKNAELERLNELKNRFLGIAAHDLRNPLGIVLNLSEFLIEGLTEDCPPENKEFLDIIHDSASSMLRLVTELLDFSKIESGKIDLNLSTFDVVSYCRTKIPIYQTLANGKEVRIRFETNLETQMIESDQGKLDQVVNNLLGNALKFSYQGSEIVVNLIREGKQVLLSVTDFGKGIQPENLEKIFLPFAGSTTGTQGEKGTGLGLAIVKRIVEIQHGQIWVESIPEKQTTFFVRLPISQ